MRTYLACCSGSTFALSSALPFVAPGLWSVKGVSPALLAMALASGLNVRSSC